MKHFIRDRQGFALPEPGVRRNQSTDAPLSKLSRVAIGLIISDREESDTHLRGARAVIDPHVEFRFRDQAVLSDDKNVEMWKRLPLSTLANLKKRRAAHVRHQRSNSTGAQLVYCCEWREYRGQPG